MGLRKKFAVLREKNLRAECTRTELVCPTIVIRRVRNVEYTKPWLFEIPGERRLSKMDARETRCTPQRETTHFIFFLLSPQLSPLPHSPSLSLSLPGLSRVPLPASILFSRMHHTLPLHLSIVLGHPSRSLSSVLRRSWIMDTDLAGQMRVRNSNRWCPLVQGHSSEGQRCSLLRGRSRGISAALSSCPLCI